VQKTFRIVARNRKASLFRRIIMSNHPLTEPVLTRNLRVLLLVCAGALLVIVFTLISSIEEVNQSKHDRTSIEAISGCEAVSHLKYILPPSQQPAINIDCTPPPETDLR
jgi:hypothetical protein